MSPPCLCVAGWWVAPGWLACWLWPGMWSTGETSPPCYSYVSVIFLYMPLHVTFLMWTLSHILAFLLCYKQMPWKMGHWFLLRQIKISVMKHNNSTFLIPCCSSNVGRFFLRPDTTKVDHAIPLRDNWALPYFSCQVAALTGFLSNNISSATEVCLSWNKIMLEVQHCIYIHCISL